MKGWPCSYTQVTDAGLKHLRRDRAGTGGDNLRGLASIFFFELPTFSSDAIITNAELQLEYVEIEGDPEFNIDLFGIDARPKAIFDASDYYDGDAASSSDALIEASLITKSTTVGNLSVANSRLLNFVNSLYNVDGTPVSAFAAFRVNPDKDLPVGSSPIRGYFLALADHPTASFRPRLNLTVIPEPLAAEGFGRPPRGPIGERGRRGRIWPEGGKKEAWPTLAQLSIQKIDGEMNRETKKLVSLYHETREADKRAQVQTRLRDLTQKHFDVRQKRRQLEISRWEGLLKCLRAEMEKRKNAKEQIIERCIKSLLGEDSHLDW